MNRLVVLTLIASVGSGSLAVAGESLAQSGSRIIREAEAQAVATGSVAATSSPASPIAASQASWVNRIGGVSPAALQGQPVLSNSGLRKRTKVMIYLAAGVGFAATAYAIDHKVLNVTPSSLGTRKD